MKIKYILVLKNRYIFSQFFKYKHMKEQKKTDTRIQNYHKLLLNKMPLPPTKRKSIQKHIYIK